MFGTEKALKSGFELHQKIALFKQATPLVPSAYQRP
jgi:hypothetical protein